MKVYKPNGSGWYVRFYDHNKKRRAIKGFNDKPATTELGRGIDRLVTLRNSPNIVMADSDFLFIKTLRPDTRDRLREWGIIDDSTQALDRPLLEHVNDFEDAMAAKGNRCVDANRVRWIIDGCKFNVWADIDAGKLRRWLRGRRDLKSRTRNHYAGEMRAFCNWMVFEGHAESSPLLGRMKADPITDAKERKALTVDQVEKLIQGPNAMIYLFAVETGLRAGVIRGLRVEQIDLIARLVRTTAGQQKNKRPHDVPMRPSLVAELRKHLRNKHPNALAFHLPDKCAVMLRKDMDSAGLDSTGFDFHCLRHTCGTFLASAGVNMKVVQQVLGHATFALTADTYSHLYDDAVRDGVAQLPDLKIG